MARNNPKVSPEVAVELVDLARQMSRLLYGGDGVPEWGTKFSQIEAESLEVGRELSRLMMEQAVGEQSQRVPSSALEGADSGDSAAVIGREPSVLETTAGEVQWQQPKTRLSKARRDFFPQAQALGVDVDQELSPSLQEKVALVGELLKSFPQAASAVDQLLGLTIGRMRFERVTERIGAERVAQRDRAAEQVAELRLMDKIDGPVGVTPPVVAAVMADGGRFQQNVAQPDSGKHWYEYKAGLCLTLGTLTDANDTTAPRGDPCPEVPLSLLNFEHVETLTREIAQRTASSSRRLPGELRPDETGVLLEELRASTKLDDIVKAADKVVRTEQRSPRELPFSPKIKSRELVATTGNASEFGRLLIARAWRLGLFQAIRKGFVADGGSWLWTLFVMAFQPFGFVGILDIIHAVTYVFAAAMADRDRAEGWTIYRRWITWIWQGQVSRVIAELQTRALELGDPTDTDPLTSPRRVVASTLTYLQNHQQYMNYPRYRELGLPLTSSVMESTMKELNYRVKGTEKFWSQPGAEALLQLRSDRLSDSHPLTTFWTTRQQTRPGLHARSCLTPA